MESLVIIVLSHRCAGLNVPLLELYFRARVEKHTRSQPLKLKAPRYTAAGQVESRFFRRFTPAIVQKPEEAQTPLKESYKRQQTPASAA